MFEVLRAEWARQRQGRVVADRTLGVLEVSALGVAATSLALRPGDWVGSSTCVFPPASC